MMIGTNQKQGPREVFQAQYANSGPHAGDLFGKAVFLFAL